jgi:vitamin B12 transporter
MQRKAASKRRPRATAFAVAILMTLAAAGAGAQTASLEPVVITGSRTGQALDEALAPITLISRADIERLQVAELVELIARQAGVQFARSGGPGSQASVFARGAGSGQVLVLVDGMRLNTVTSGAAVLGGIALDAIDRIEIVRGNLSSLYGSEAIGGVVQIFTRGSGAPREVALAVEGGSGATYGGAISATETLGRTRLSATVAGRHSEPFSALDTRVASGANPDQDGNRQFAGALRASHALTNATTLGFSAWTQRNRTAFDDAFDGPTATHDEKARSEAWQASARHALTDVWTLRAQAGQAREESDNRSSLATSFNNGRFESRNRAAQLQAEALLAERVTATFGFEHLDQRGASTGYDPAAVVLTEFGRHVTSAWFGVTGRTLDAGRQSVQLSVRHDDYSDVGDTDTWLVAYGYALTPRLRVVAQASTAFRAPSFNDLHYPFFGNPNLAPEKAKSVELGLRYANAGARASLALFRTRTRDLIQYDFTTSQAGNVARARAEGVEFTAGATLGPWRIDGNAAWLDARDEATEARLLRRAPWTVNLGLFHDQGRWRLGGEAGWVDKRVDVDLNTFARKDLPAYTLLRALLQFKATARLTLKLRVENLLDQTYTLVDGYRTAGRAAFAGIDWRM